MNDTTHCQPSAAVPCLTCGCEPIAWQAKGLWHVACIVPHAKVDIVNPGPDLDVLVREWNRLNCSEKPNSSSKNGESQ